MFPLNLSFSPTRLPLTYLKAPSDQARLFFTLPITKRSKSETYSDYYICLDFLLKVMQPFMLKYREIEPGDAIKQLENGSCLSFRFCCLMLMDQRSFDLRLTKFSIK